jgi:hypothetical protein
MALDFVRADFFFERHVDALGDRFPAFFAGLPNTRFGDVFSQKAYLVLRNHGLNL